MSISGLTLESLSISTPVYVSFRLDSFPYVCRILITIATYVANLSALQTIAPTTGVVINTLLDLKGQKIAVIYVYGPLVTSLYPSVQVTILNPSVSVADSFNLLKVVIRYRHFSVSLFLSQDLRIAPGHSLCSVTQNGTYDVLFTSRILTPNIILVNFSCKSSAP